jgi:hypothetical protein
MDNNANKDDRADHKQVRIDGINVDVGIADLLVYLWNAGVNTDYSCRGSIDSLHASAYISFLDNKSFDIAWLLIVDLVNSLELQDVIKKYRK